MIKMKTKEKEVDKKISYLMEKRKLEIQALKKILKGFESKKEKKEPFV